MPEGRQDTPHSTGSEHTDVLMPNGAQHPDAQSKFDIQSGKHVAVVVVELAKPQRVFEQHALTLSRHGAPACRQEVQSCGGIQANENPFDSAPQQPPGHSLPDVHSLAHLPFSEDCGSTMHARPEQHPFGTLLHPAPCGAHCTDPPAPPVPTAPPAPPAPPVPPRLTHRFDAQVSPALHVPLP